MTIKERLPMYVALESVGKCVLRFSPNYEIDPCSKPDLVNLL